MSMIERYRKKGGFVQLLNLIETTGKDKQEKFLKMIADESAAWESEIRKRLLTFDKVVNWDPQYLAEIFPRVPALNLAMICGGLPPEKAELFMKVMTFREKRQIEELLKEKVPSPGETSASIMKLFSEIRKMEADGLLRFEKFDPAMVIPENIEDMLGKGQVVMTPIAGGAADVSAHSAPPPAGTPANVVEELSALRRKLVQLTQENQRLHQENTSMKDKLDQIKKIA